jgi:pullulanase
MIGKTLPLVFGMMLAAIQSVQAAGFNANEQTCSVEFVVRSTADVPDAASIFLAGSLPSMGPWKPDGLQLVRAKDSNEWKGTLNAKKGDVLQYKCTQGTWGTVEKTAQGKDIPNRVLRIVENSTVEITVEGWSKSAVQRSTVTGDIDILEIQDDSIAATRRVQVWRPNVYTTSSDRYPVLYLMDGQNVFDSATAAFGVEWQADENADSLIARNEILPIFIVAIDNSKERIREYTRDKVGLPMDHLEWLIQMVKPEVDRRYRTLPDPADTTLGGSSLGGLFALEAFSTKTEIFGNAICMSPSLAWDEERLLKSIESEGLESRPRNATFKRKLWLDFGTTESPDPARSVSHVERLLRLSKAIESNSSDDSIELQTYLDEGAAHNEKAWARRFPDALRFIYGTTR